MPGLKIARQPHCRWLGCPVTDVELEEAYLAHALFDAHRDDPELGYRFLADEARDSGRSACDRSLWRVCSNNYLRNMVGGLLLGALLAVSTHALVTLRADLTRPRTPLSRPR